MTDFTAVGLKTQEVLLVTSVNDIFEKNATVFFSIESKLSHMMKIFGIYSENVNVVIFPLLKKILSIIIR